MPLDPDIVDRIRDEIGPDLDVSDEAENPPAPLGDLETIYNSELRGGFNVLRTALIVWKRRKGAFQSRGFDASTGGSLMTRSQRLAFLDREIKRLEILVDYTLKGTNSSVSVADAPVESSEFS